MTISESAADPNPIKLDLLCCVPCYIPSNDPYYLLRVDR